MAVFLGAFVSSLLVALNFVSLFFEVRPVISPPKLLMSIWIVLKVIVKVLLLLL